MTDSRGSDESMNVPFRLHPRVFAALGADLVTNDVVAVIELVKNSYDAFARNVWVRFLRDSAGDSLLEIEDDGSGMSRSVIEDVWCVVATPFKKQNPYVTCGEKKRRVVGDKGLGRLSAARLGGLLKVLTRCRGGPCHSIEVDWRQISQGERVEDSFVKLGLFDGQFRRSGTLLRIGRLNSEWDDSRVADLEENLSRLISPFSEAADFNIHLAPFESSCSEEIRIQAPEFLSKPKYVVAGEADDQGNVGASYEYRPITGGPGRERPFEMSWEQIYDGIQDRIRFAYRRDRAGCGRFSFVIRAWDIGSEDTQEISDSYGLQKSLVRRSIRAHKGISVYRDGVLVLPKSENARDWLGLDLRRVSKVGVRVSTSQIVGYVSISAERNPGVADTSDRERLASRIEVAEFEEILKAVIGRLELERAQDRESGEGPEKTMESLFDDMSPRTLEEQAEALIEQDAGTDEILPLVRDYVARFESGREKITRRLVYYSRLAAIGTIAQMLIHEIRNRTTVFGTLLDFVKERFGPANEPVFKERFRQADHAVDALERLADTFAPLANRNFKRGKKTAIVENSISTCLSVLEDEIRQKSVRLVKPDSTTRVSIDPGELEAVILNLATNALYWLGRVPNDARTLSFAVTRRQTDGRAEVTVSDTGPGIEEEDAERVFLAGVTRKPGGIGMGLTVASEIISGYGGKMGVMPRTGESGTAFVFDLPLAGDK